MRWDDDIDIAIKDDDYDIVRKLVSDKAKEFGYKPLEFNYHETLMKIGALDIFTLKWMKGPYGEAYYFKENQWNSQWPKMRYLSEEVDPKNLEECQFWDLSLLCPKNGREALKREFGDDVFTKAYIYNHGTKEALLQEIDLTTNLNQHCGLIPAMDKALWKKLMFKD